MKKKTLTKIIVGLAVWGMTLVGCSNDVSEDIDKTDKRYEIYQLALSDGYTGSYEEWLNSIKGKDGADGKDGQDGHSPTIEIGDDGYWYIDGVNTGVKAQGEKGDQGDAGQNGKDGIDGKNGQDGENGASVLTGKGEPSKDLGKDGDSYIDLDSWNYYLKENGSWELKGNIRGSDGQDGQDGDQGEKGEQGDAGKDGLDGRSVVSIVLSSSKDNVDTYTITYSDNTTSTFTVTNGVNGQNGSDGEKGDQGIQGNPGADGHTPVITIGQNGNWFVDGVDTNIKAQGPKGDQGDKGDTGVSIISTEIDENGDLIVTFSNGETANAGHVKDVNTYTVNFYVDDDLVATRQALSGQKVSRPTTTETAGYTINYWYTKDGNYNERWNFQGCVITEDTNIYADFSCNEYTISFVDNRFQNNINNVVVSYDKPYAFETLTHTGYTHKNYIDSNNNEYGISGTWRIANNLTLYVNWANNEYVVSLNPNGGILDNDSITVSYENPYQLPTPVRTNYVFLGWYEGETRISSSATWKYASNKSFTAKWTNVTNTYVFDAGDGNCNSNSMVIGWEDNYQLPTPTCPAGLAFGGWYLGNIYIPQTGKWTYSNNGGTLVASYYEDCLTISNNVVTGVKYKTFTSVAIPNSVTSIGKSAFRDCTSLTSIFIPNSVTSIGDSAFNGCSSLTSISIPNSVTSIGIYAFSDCISMTSFTLGSKVTSIGSSAFLGCLRLVEVINKSALNIKALSSDYGYAGYYAKQVISNEKDSKLSTSEDGFVTYNDGVNVSLISYAGKNNSITIPSDVTYINYGAFYKCTSLQSIAIPDSVTSISQRMFFQCTSLQSISIPNSVTSIGSEAFYGCTSLQSISIPNSVTSIGGNAFFQCTSLSSITIPDSVTYIGGGAFSNCTSLEFNTYNNAKYLGNNTNPYLVLVKAENTYINWCDISNRCKIIYSNSFYNCSYLTSIVIPNSVISIGGETFKECSSLSSIAIPDSVTYIGLDAFSNCTSLEFNTYNNAKYLGNNTNPYLVLIKANNASITSCNISEKCKFIYSSSFSGCSSLASITIPDSVTSIGYGAFSRCSSLSSITIPDSVASIGDSAFYGCASLESVEISNSVTSIGDRAFYSCVSLLLFVVPNSVLSIGSDAFVYCSALEKILYFGSETEWSYISGACDTQRIKTIFYYSETEPASPGNYWHYVDGTPTIW